MSVKEDVKKVIIETLKIEPEKVTDDARFEYDLKADSLEQTELIMALEDQFKLDIPEQDVQELTTVGKAIEYIEKKVGGQGE